MAWLWDSGNVHEKCKSNVFVGLGGVSATGLLLRVNSCFSI